MASFATQILFILLFTLFSTFFIKINGEFLRQSIIMSTKRMEKITCLHFYFHDIVDGKHPTAMQIIRVPNRTATSLVTTFMVDDPLTEKLEPTSKLVGRAQEIYAFASQHDFGLLMLMNFAFPEGMYNGSAVSIVGRNAILDAVREMPLSEVVEFAGLAVARLWQRQFGLIRMEML
ncbi:hypothetical protein Golob_027424 [Gossypium lobatum]|uniref:Dirigent protein n=1 Tax=Gossypium lobatum TaxID=34289 RepID=A0A7J8NGP4_9ROSI|nr:hypothetical protein [Gossypium lobatum]